MLNKIWHVILPNVIGLGLIVLGWSISILNVRLSSFRAEQLFSTTTLVGLVLILIGAYLPRIWSKIRGN